MWGIEKPRQGLFLAQERDPWCNQRPVSEADAEETTQPTQPAHSPLRPLLCGTNGDARQPTDSGPTLNRLHNEEPRNDDYPLQLGNGQFFSEALGPNNPDGGLYRTWIVEALRLIACGMKEGGGALPVERLDAVGRLIQQLDADFARTRIGRPRDALHDCHGSDPGHPYRKITLCRVGFPLLVAGAVQPFLYEKFLVSYSYWENNRRRSTVTPLHSHPWNHEVVYFLEAGPRARVLEEEYLACDKEGRPAVGPDGVFNARLRSERGGLRLDQVRLKKIDEHCRRPTSEPIVPEAFASDDALQAPDLLRLTEGLFRPHRVRVVDDPDRETYYYAVNNYWSPTGRVLVYRDDGTIETWSHAAWSGSEG